MHYNGGNRGTRNNTIIMNNNNKYDELNYPDLISASIQTCNASQIPLLLSSKKKEDELTIPTMPPPLSSATIQRIQENLKWRSMGSSGTTAAALQSRRHRYAFEVEREVLARHAERRWNESTSSSSSAAKAGNTNVVAAKSGGPVDAPPANHPHGREGVEVDDSTGCPIMLSNASSSSCGEFLGWK